MIDSKALDLIIRAKVQKGGDLKKITQSIAELGATIEEQAAAAKKGEGSIETLRDAYDQLQQVADRLKSQADLVGQFQRTGAAIEGTTKRVDAAKKRLDEYAATVANVDQRTQKQEERLIRLSAAYQKAQSTLAAQKSTYAELGAQLRTTGVDTANLAAVEDKLRVSAADIGVSFSKASNALRTHSADMKAATADVRAFEVAERNANAAREARAKAHAEYDAKRSAVAAEAESNRRLDAELAAQAKNFKSAAQSAEVFRQALDKLDADKAAATKGAELNKLAADSQKAAASASTLARASDNLTPKFASLRDTIRGVIDPAAKVRGSLAGVESEVNTLANSIASINGPVKEYQQRLAALAAAQKSVGQQADMIDNFRRQVASLREAREGFVQARNQVNLYAQAVRQGGADTDANVAALNRSQAAMQRSAAVLRQSVISARESRDALRTAGIATNDLGAAQGRLINTARQATNSVGGLTAAVQKYGIASERAATVGFGAGKGMAGFGVFNRIRQDIVGATAATIGLYGAFNLARSAIEALSKTEVIRNKLAVATESNDPAVIGKEFDYVRKTADYYGVSLNELASSYGSFAIAGKAANLTSEQTRYTFEQLTAGMRVLGMNTDQSGRAFTQVQQILSKTKPEMEDIKTIAESGFAGVQGLMAKGLLEIGHAGIRAGSEIQDMAALMKKGMLDSQTAIYALAVAAEKELGARVPEAIRSLRAEQGRFETSVMDFQRTIAESGFAEEYRKALEEIRKFFASSQGTELAGNISTAFGTIAQSVVWVIQNLDGLTTALKTLFALWAVNTTGNLVAGLLAYDVQLKSAIVTTNLAATAVSGLTLVFRGLAAFIAGWAIGTYLLNEFEFIQRGAIELGAFMHKTVARIEGVFTAFTADLPGMFEIAFGGIWNACKKYMGYVLDALKWAAAGTGQLSVFMQMDAQAKKLKAGDDFDPAKVKLNANAQAAIDDMNKKIAEIEEARKDFHAVLDQPEGTKKTGVIADAPGTAYHDFLPQPGRPGKPKGRLDDEEKKQKALEKRQKMIESLDTALDQLEAKIDRSSTNTLAQQLEAVDKQYEALRERIGKIGGKTGAEFIERLGESTVQLKAQITAKFDAALVDAHGTMQDKLNTMDAKAGRKDTANLGSRIAAIHSTYQSFYDDLSDLRLKYSQNGRDTTELDILKQRADSNIILLQDAEREKFAVEESAAAQREVNAVLSQRKSLIDGVNNRMDAGLISEATARDEIKKIIEDTQPQLDLMIEKAKAIAFVLMANKTISPEQYDAIIAKLELAGASGRKYANALTQAQEAAAGMITGGVVSGLEEVGSQLVEAAKGQQSWTDAIKNSALAFADLTAQVLRDIAKMILQEQILAAVRGYMGVTSGGATTVAGVRHMGGLIGSMDSRSRSVPAAWFANAPRYHAGGIAGLAADEYPTILQKNEEVLAKDSPRNVMNAAGVSAAAGGAGTRFVLVDDRAKVPEAMSSAEGERVIVEAVRRNIPTIKRYMK